MIINFSNLYCVVLLVLVSQVRAYGQESEPNQSVEMNDSKRHFVSINPLKPFIGLPNLNYEFRLRKGIGITAFSEVLAYTVIPNFNHPDALNTIGASFYPFIDEQVINQGTFINVNTSYVVFFRDETMANSFANGIQIGYKYLFKKNAFLEPKLVTNYIYNNKDILPGFEILLGLNL